MPLSEAGLVAIIVALLGSGVWQAVESFIKSRREEPITRRDTEIAATERTQAMTLALLDQVQEQYESERTARIALAAEVKEIRARNEAEIREIREQSAYDSQQIRKLRVALDALLAWGARIHLNWEQLRKQATPPALPDVELD